MNTSSILKKVLVELEFSKTNSSFNYRYVCYNFLNASHSRNYDSKKISEFLEFVCILLNNTKNGSTLGSWLVNNGHITRDEFKQTWVFGSPEYLKLQETRIQWVKWMIEQYEAKGD